MIFVNHDSYYFLSDLIIIIKSNIYDSHSIIDIQFINHSDHFHFETQTTTALEINIYFITFLVLFIFHYSFPIIIQFIIMSKLNIIHRFSQLSYIFYIADIFSYHFILLFLFLFD